MVEHLTSLKNPRVQAWRMLKERKTRVASGTFLVEGRKMVEEAVASGFDIDAILVDEARLGDFAQAEQTTIYALPEHVLAAVCDTKTPQGIAAVVRMPKVGEMGERVIVLDGVQDPGNVGTIIRTADAAGFDSVLLSTQCADVYSPKVLRATMGSVFHLPVRIEDHLSDVLGELVARGYSVVSSQLDGQPFYSRAGIASRFCLVIGNEGNGVTEEVKAVSTHHLKLPMRGLAESLNAAVAAGIMMYELMRE